MTSYPTNRRERFASRSIDVIVHGATGYTGRRVVRHLVTKHPSLNVAICGRNKDKLAVVAAEVAWDDAKKASSVFVVSDASKDTSGAESAKDGAPELIQVFSQSKIVIACAGPYRQCGMPIITAAVASVSDCLVTIVFDQWAGANATTFHAAVDGFYAASSGELAASRKKVKESYPEFQETMPPSRPKEWPKIPETPGLMPGHNEGLGLRTLKFVGADASAIRSSWRYLRSRVPEHARKGKNVPEPRLSVLMGMDSKDTMSAAKLIVYGATFSTLARFKWGCDVLHNYPEAFSGGVFTSKGPSEEELQNAKFTTYVTAYGSNYSDGDSSQVARVKVGGPEPGYVATPALIVALALTILEAGKYEVGLAFDSGCTLPGALFGDCEKVYDNMRAEGVSFDVVQEFGGESQSPV
eukprot:scaffold1373_cov288-Alexandrium_tamarense.AAC.9